MLLRHMKAEKIGKGAELESLSFAKAMKDTKFFKTHTCDTAKVIEVKVVSIKSIKVFYLL